MGKRKLSEEAEGRVLQEEGIAYVKVEASSSMRQACGI